MTMDFVRFGFCLAQGVLYWLAQSTQRAQRRFVDCRAPMNVNHFLLHLSYHHALHGRDAVRCSKLHLHCVSTLYFILYTLYFILYTSYFILHTLYFILRCMVETQYDAASCISTASLRYTSLPTSKKHLHKSSKPTDYLIRFLRNNCA